MSDRDCGTKFELCGDCIRCLRHQRDYARERLKDAASDLADLTDQHEVLRAEVERLRDSGTVLVRSLERMTAERDEAQAEAERLRAERRQLRARLVECRPWVGVCPWPDTPGWRDVMAVRDLADDTLREVE